MLSGLSAVADCLASPSDPRSYQCLDSGLLETPTTNNTDWTIDTLLVYLTWQTCRSTYITSCYSGEVDVTGLQACSSAALHEIKHDLSRQPNGLDKRGQVLCLQSCLYLQAARHFAPNLIILALEGLHDSAAS